jgi:hypothetical protein
MIRRTNIKPSCFDHLPDDSFFFEMLHKDEVCANVGVQIASETGHLHIEYVKFNRQILKTTVDKAFPEIMKFCEDRGCSMLVVSKGYETEKELDKWKWYIQSLGFPIPARVEVSTMEIN